MTDHTAERAPNPAADVAQATLKLDEFLPYRLNVCSSLVTQALSRIYAGRSRIGASIECGPQA